MTWALWREQHAQHDELEDKLQKMRDELNTMQTDGKQTNKAADMAAVAPTSEWTVENVTTWVLEQGIGYNVATTLAQGGVDGGVLLHIDESDIRDDFGISGPGAKKLLEGVQKLRSQCVSADTDSGTRKWWWGGRKQNPEGCNGAVGVPRMSFHQYRALNRNAMDAMVPALFGLAPRFALIILAVEFPAHGQPNLNLEEDGWMPLFWCLVWPHCYIFAQADNICGGLPMMLRVGILCALLRQFLQLVLSIGPVVSGKKSLLSLLTEHTGFYEEIGSALLIFQCRIVIYPYVPGFICTAFFHLVLNLGPLFMIFHSFFMIHYHYSRWSTPPRRSTPRRSATKMLQGAEVEKAAAMQVKLDHLMKGKALSFWPFSWDLHATDTNAPILNGLAAILKEAPQLAINIHGEQMAKSDKKIAKDAKTGKTFEACFPGIENTVRPDAVARARVLSTLKALKDLGCTNTMTVTHVFSTVKQITFQVKGLPAANGGANAAANGDTAAAKIKAGVAGLGIGWKTRGPDPSGSLVCFKIMPRGAAESSGLVQVARPYKHASTFMCIDMCMRMHLKDIQHQPNTRACTNKITQCQC